VTRGGAEGSIVGQQGLERAYNDLLNGDRRRQARRRQQRRTRNPDARGDCAGRGAAACSSPSTPTCRRAAEDGFRLAGFNGAALILDPRNGEVLTYASLPSYDPNDFSVGIDRATWASLNTDKLKPLQNRVLQGPLLARLHLQDRRRRRPRSKRGSSTPTSASPATAARTSSDATSSATSRRARQPWTCATPIEKSCNVLLLHAGQHARRGQDSTSGRRSSAWSARPGIDLPNEQESIVPSTEWKMKRYGEKWYAGETISVSIGQGQVAVTPRRWR
jgi:penicillin-binding protein 2